MKLPRPNGLPRKDKKKKGLSDERLEQMAEEMPHIYKSLLVEATRLTEEKHGRKVGPLTTEEEQDAFLRASGVDVEEGLRKAMATINEERTRRAQARAAAGGPTEKLGNLDAPSPKGESEK